MSGTTRGRRRVRLLIRALVGAVSVAVLAVSAFAWTQLRELDRSTASASVIRAPAAPAAPSAEQNILLLGVDSRTDPQGAPLPDALLAALHAGDGTDGGDTADSITVVHVPAGGGRATAISIPRDSYVQLVDGYGKHKINSAYSRAVTFTTDSLTSTGAGGAASSPFAPASSRAGSPDDPAVRRAALEAGARTTIGTVEQLTGLSITHYASVNLAGFADVSAALGGVPVCLRAPVDDPYSGLRLAAGPQEVSGAQALAFVRQRHGLPGGDLARITRQQTFLASATHRILSAGTLTDPFALDRLSGVLTRSVTLDSGWNVLSFAGQLQGLAAGAVTFRTIPTGDTELSTPSDGTAVHVDPVAVRQFVDDSIAVDAGQRLPTPTPIGWSDAAHAHAVATGGADEGADGGSSTGTASSGRTSVVPAAAPVTPPITAAAPGCIN